MIEQIQPVPFKEILNSLYTDMLDRSQLVDVGEWQSQIGSGARTRTLELSNVVFSYPVPLTVAGLRADVRPNLPWADEHFNERVGGVPVNPPPSSANWPFRDRGHAEHLKHGQFSHTYPERMWPKHANVADQSYKNMGIRYHLGDLQDVVELLKDRPLTRQAYLPIWFPEDTGAVHGQRVPCSLGYHFMIRHQQGTRRLQTTYVMRSCDLYRHFKDDVYLAARLSQWMASSVGVIPSELLVHITSLHVFESDRPLIATLRRRLDDE